MKRNIIIAFVAVAIAAGLAFATNGPQPSVGLYWFDNTDPTVPPGMNAPLNQLLIRTDAPSIYYKSGTANTAWTQVGISTAGGAGTVTSVTCSTGLACTPNPITTAGTVAVNLTPTTCAAGQAEISTAANGTSACAPFAPAASVSGTTNVMAKFTSSTSVGNSNVDDNGTTLSIPHSGAKFQITEATGATTINDPAGATPNVDPAALYVNGTLGIGDPGANTPGTYLDLRHNWQVGWDDLEVVNAGPNTANGVEIDYVRSYGTLAAPISTTVTTEISHVAIWGYDTNNALQQGARERWTVDQANSAGAVPMRFDIWNANTAGVLQDNFRFDSGHHFSVLDAVAPVLTLCGGGATIVGSDQAGTISVGTAAPGCTLTFHISWAITTSGAAVHCTLKSRTGLLFEDITSQTAITISPISPLSSSVIDYTCIAAGIP